MKKPPRESFQQLSGALSLATVARRVGVPRREIRRMIQHGKLPFVQVLGQIRVPRSAIESRGR
jgi:excisionase family DNA binding protein